eukprot:CAMPEP_0117430930 /NCGR_PEP_ID=MMETSP0758-20121206/10491_1 /TAXON_ID=63605 /ORGANISM="Percolomonas cosmopolitus, Strain AE-1 (ATCC 50343)" /LENGTH=563 /DNA_ID=CAMNT_0005219485 /DNA_START=296 /DNA_END=1987 /DNA_ORIENTATION=-
MAFHSLPPKTLLSKTRQESYVKWRKEKLHAYLQPVVHCLNKESLPKTWGPQNNAPQPASPLSVNLDQQQVNTPSEEPIIEPPPKSPFTTSLQQLYQLNDTILGFMDVDASPISHQFSRCRYGPPPLLPLYAKNIERLSRIQSYILTERYTQQEYEQQHDIPNLEFAATRQKLDDIHQLFYNSSYEKLKSYQQEFERLCMNGDTFVIQLGGKMMQCIISPHSLVYLLPFDALSSIPTSRDTLDKQPPHYNTEASLISSIDSAKVYSISDIKSIARVCNRYHSSGLEPLSLKFHPPLLPLTIYAAERTLIEEVFGIHLKRYKLAQRCFYAAYNSYYSLCKSIEFRDEAHVDQLYNLWKTLFPEEPLLSRKSDQWTRIGFQSNDPATDFRGMGLLGLHFINYISKHHTSRVRTIIDKDPEYPFCVSCINLLSHIFDLLHSSDHVVSNVTLSSKKPIELWSGPAFSFLIRQIALSTTLHQDALVFPKDPSLPNDLLLHLEDLFCVLVFAFDRHWHRLDADYFQFSRVLEIIKETFLDVLKNHPPTLISLEYQLNEALSEKDDSPIFI